MWQRARSMITNAGDTWVRGRMGDWLEALELPRSERHRVLAEQMCDAIRRHNIAPGTRLPTHRDLARRLDTSVSTITRAYRELLRRGMVEATVGRGTFVASGNRPVRQVAKAKDQEERPDSPALDVLSLPVLHRDHLVDLSLNEPLPSISRKCVELGLDAVARTSDRRALAGYQSAVGSSRHRSAGKKWLGEIGVRIRGQELAVVAGGQCALTAILLSLCGAGGTILTEDLSWPGLLSLANALAVRVVPVTTDVEGIVPDDLTSVLRRETARLLYTMPTLHNPIGTTASLERRKAIAQIAATNNLMIVEDDAYGFATAARQPSYLSLAPDHSIYVTSLSKPLTPALRVAYLATTPSVLGRVISTLHATALMISPIVAEMATLLIESGEARQLAVAQADVGRRRQKLARELGLAAATAEPSDGMHLWMPVGPRWRTQDFVAQALRIGVSVSPGTVFAATPGSDPKAVRICLNAVESEDMLFSALQKLRALRGFDEGFSTRFL